MKLHILAVGRIKNTVFEPVLQEYIKRLRWSLDIKEVPVSSPQTEMQACLQHCPPQAVHVAMEEGGDLLDSPGWARKIQSFQDQSYKHMVFWIGGPEGLSLTMPKAHWRVSFGRMTWPHLLVRVMLVEQIYRAQQILDGHPYHRGSLLS